MGEPHFVSCSTWIRKGVCKEIPLKTKSTKFQLQRLINNLHKSHKGSGDGDECDENNSIQHHDPSENPEDESDDPYSMAAYDADDPEEATESTTLNTHGTGNSSHNGFSNGHQMEQYSDSDSDDEELRVGSNESMIVTGQVDGDAGQLIFYVFDESEGSVFLHHDIMLSSFPTCVEWLGLDGIIDAPGNLVAVGGILPRVELWPVDVLNCVEPVCTLGEGSIQRARRLSTGHTDSVTCLTWNTHLEHLLASGSADGTVILWDLHAQCQSAKLNCTKKQVQSARWRVSNNNNASHLLTGDSSRYISMWECQTEERKRWKLSGEVEQVMWDRFSNDGALAITDDGGFHYIDVRQEKTTVWSVQAHDKDCTGLWLSDSISGCALTTSSDGCVRVWDTMPPSSPPSSSSSPAELVAEHELKLGSLYCVSGCSDLPWTVCLGGDNRDNSMYVWDIRHLDCVRNRFDKRASHVKNSGKASAAAISDADDTSTTGAAKSNANISAAESATNRGPVKRPKADCSESESWKTPSSTMKINKNENNKKKMKTMQNRIKTNKKKFKRAKPNV